MQIFKSPIRGVYGRTLSEQGWSPPGVSLLAARRMWPTTRGEGAVIAVIDTGVDYKHGDLAANIAGGKSFVAAEQDFMDYNGHGTHVAGTIAARGKIWGMAPDSKILVVKVLNKNGQGTYSDITRGIAWARQWSGDKGERVNVMNLSLGGPLPNNDMHRELIKVAQAGITVVCAAGNSGDGRDDTPEISYPAYYPECLAVGAVELDSRIANFSNSNDQIDIVAPGVETYSTYPDNQYVKLSGTSMAAPHISGAAALMYSRYKMRFQKYPEQGYIEESLRYQAIDLGRVGLDNLYGFGLFSFNMDGGKAIRLLMGSRKYFVNGKEYYFKKEPFGSDSAVAASVQELCELLSCDSTVIPAGDTSDDPKGQITIWS